MGDFIQHVILFLMLNILCDKNVGYDRYPQIIDGQREAIKK